MTLITLTSCDMREGPSLWSPTRCARSTLRFPCVAPPPGTRDRLTRLLKPLLDADACHRAGARRGWVDLTLEQDVRRPILHLLVQAVLALHGQADASGVKVWAAPARDDDTIWLYSQFEEKSVAGLAIATAVALVNLSVDTDREAEAGRHLAAFVKQVANNASRLPVLQALKRRGIPYRELDVARAIVEAGWGRSTRRFHLGATDRTGRIANEIASDKHLANRVMRQHGVPVPRQASVTTLEAALAAAETIGYPVVAKPRGTDKGVAVNANLQNAEGLAAAFAEARRHGPVIIEGHLPGDGHRLLVVDNAVIAVSRLLSARVVGDGESTVAELVARENASRGQSVSHATPSLLRLGDETERVLETQGLTLQATPARGQVVAVRSASNTALGGTWEDVTHLAHPTNLAVATRAARAVGLDTAGVDFLCPDISRPYTETGGGVCEINPKPGLHGYFLAPGSPNVPSLYVDYLFPPGSDGRLPLVVVHGADRLSIVSAVAECAGLKALTLGVATRRGVAVDGVAIVEGAFDNRDGAWMVLADPAVSGAVLEVGAPDVIARGLGYDRAAVCILHGLDPRTPAHLRASCARLLIETSDVLLANSADRQVRELVGARANVIWYDGAKPEALVEGLAVALPGSR